MLLTMSISGGVLIILIIVLRFFAINNLPKKVFVLLWDIVLLRLLIPFNLPISYGIASPAAKIVDNGIGLYNASYSPITQGNTKELTFEAVNITQNRITWITIAYLAGMITLLVIFGMLYFKEYQTLQSALPVTGETENNFRSAAIPKRVKLMVSDRISTPLAFGIISPEIIFPRILSPSDNEEIKYVLTHEVIHIKRFDNLWKVIMLIAVSIHWFNPFVWIMYILFNRDIELSCDEKVISLLGENTKKEYAMALVNLAEKQYHWSFFSNGFGKNAIQERIVAIMKFKRVTYISAGCAVLLLAGAITVFAQNDSKASDSNNPYLYSSQEGVDASAGLMRAVADSEWFSEYEKYGLSYDSSANHLIYDGDVVGYFKDEISEGKYTRVFDNNGTISVIVLRDSMYQVIGLEKTDIPNELDSGPVIENPIENPEPEESSSFASVEKTINNTDYEGNTASENMEAISSEDITYEEGYNNSMVLRGYESYGISYDSSEDAWIYNGKHIAGLIGDNNIYVDESVNTDSVYLQIGQKSAKEISSKQFNALMNAYEPDRDCKKFCVNQI